MIKSITNYEGYVSEDIPTLILEVCTKELYNEDDDELKILTLYKEYPDVDFEDFEEVFEKIDVSDIEDEYATLDFTGAGMTIGFTIPDNGELDEDMSKQCFEKIIKICEKQLY